MGSVKTPHVGAFYYFIVVVGGHAGCEARGCVLRGWAPHCLLLTSIGSIRSASVPAIPPSGRFGKGPPGARDPTALTASWAAPSTAPGIQFRTLNLSKGQAVRGLARAQAIASFYRQAIHGAAAETTPTWKIPPTPVAEVLLNARGRVFWSCCQSGRRISAGKSCLTTAPSLRG